MSLAVRCVSLCALVLLASVVPASADPFPPAADPVCINLASGPDAVVFLCVDAGADCRIYTVTYGHEGETTTRCLLA